MDATMRAPGLASARTITQFLDTVLTHRAVRDDLPDDTDAFDDDGFDTTGLDTTGFAAGNVDCGVTGVAALSRSMLPLLATVVLDGPLSAVTAAISGDGAGRGAALVDPGFAAMLSAGTLMASGSSAAIFERASSGSLGPDECASHAPNASDTSAAMPTPFQTLGAIGSRSGFVPHHLHEPTCSG